MAQHKLEFKIIKDIGGKAIHLDNLSISAAKSLIILLESITKIVEKTSNSQGIKIQIKQGSAEVVAETNKIQLEEIEKNFNEIIENKSKNKDLVESWRKVQNVINVIM